MPADEDGREARLKTFEMIEHEAHLALAMSLRRMRVEMKADGAERARRRVFDIGDDGALLSEPLLFARHLVLAVRQRDGVRAPERVT